MATHIATWNALAILELQRVEQFTIPYSATFRQTVRRARGAYRAVHVGQEVIDYWKPKAVKVNTKDLEVLESADLDL
mgnify:CR=1 FL=1